MLQTVQCSNVWLSLHTIHNPCRSCLVFSHKGTQSFSCYSPFSESLLALEKILPGVTESMQRNSCVCLWAGVRKDKEKTASSFLCACGRGRRSNFTLCPSSFQPTQLFLHAYPMTLGMFFWGVRMGCRNKEECRKSPSSVHRIIGYMPLC